MAEDNRTQIIIAVIGLVGVIGTALLANVDKIKQMIWPTPKPQYSTTCEYTTGLKAGTRQHFDPAAPGVSPAWVGSPCSDYQGSYGHAVDD